MKRSLSDEFLPGYWELPGGGMNYGETPQGALMREMKEECGLEIEIIQLVAANTHFRGEVQRIEITFLCRALNPAEIKLSLEHSDYKWLKLADANTIKINDYIKKILASSAKIASVFT